MQEVKDDIVDPHAYLLKKLRIVMPLFEEARDALTVITESQRIRAGIRHTLAERMDAAGTYSLVDWEKEHPVDLLYHDATIMRLDALAELCALATGGWDLPASAAKRIGQLAEKAADLLRAQAAP